MLRELRYSLESSVVQLSAHDRHDACLIHVQTLHEAVIISAGAYHLVENHIKRTSHQLHKPVVSNGSHPGTAVPDSGVPHSTIAVDGIPQGTVHIEKDTVEMAVGRYFH